MRKKVWPILVACTLWHSAGAQAGSAIGPALPRLLSEVVVQSEYIQLSDLLPQEADLSLRSAAKKILLGRGPLPGSIRVFTTEELLRAVEDRVSVDIPERVRVRRAGYPLSEKRIQDAAQMLLGTIGWSEAQIVIPPDLATRTPNAELRATAVRSGQNSRTLMLRLECQQPRECAPFWADMSFSHPVKPPPLRSNPSLIAKGFQSPVQALVRPGRPALLLCNNSGVRISMRVLPLKRAAMGETIRVIDPETRRVFVAEVRGQNLVESRFQETK